MTLTRETIYDIVRSLNCGDGYDAYERANQATDEIWDLVEPTVREAKAAAWSNGYASGFSNAMRRMSDEPNAPITPNPYRSEARHG